METDGPNWFEKFTVLMDQNIRGIQYGVYSAAVVGLAVALRSIRPFKKFHNPRDFPASFIEKHMKLHGTAVGIEPPYGSGPALLLIDHSPIISLSLLQPQKPHLPVQISSIDLTPNGLSWLHHVIVGSPVEFRVLKVSPKFVSCIVTKQKMNIALDLVSLGFASVSPLDFVLENDPVYLKYYQKLLAAESHAEKKGKGMWALGERSPASRLLSSVPSHLNKGGYLIFKGLKTAWTKLRTRNVSVIASTDKM